MKIVAQIIIFRKNVKTELIGCYFHFKQAIQRKISKLGLSTNVRVSEVHSDIANLTLLKMENVPAALGRLRTKYGQDWKPFFDYFEKTWLQKYDPALWNIPTIMAKLGKDILTRTNCKIENYNKRINEKLLCHGSLEVRQN